MPTKTTTGNVSDIPETKTEYKWLDYTDAEVLAKKYFEKDFVRKDATEEERKNFFWKVVHIRPYEPAGYASPHPDKTLIQFELYKFHRSKYEKVVASDGKGGTTEIERPKMVDSLTIANDRLVRVDSDKNPAWLVMDLEQFKKDFKADIGE